MSNFRNGPCANYRRYIIDTSEFYHSIQEYRVDHRMPWIKIHASLITLLSRVWDCVRPILCNDAPEGHIPEDLDPESDIDTKDILSYSWRALKEARYSRSHQCEVIANSCSSLMRAVVTRAPILDHEEPSEFIGLEEQNLQDLVKLAFTELTELRHRGAFSAVAQAFAACCSRSSRSNRTDILKVFYAVCQLVFFSNLCLITCRKLWLVFDFKDPKSQEGQRDCHQSWLAFYLQRLMSLSFAK